MSDLSPPSPTTSGYGRPRPPHTIADLGLPERLVHDLVLRYKVEETDDGFSGDSSRWRCTDSASMRP